MNDDFEYYLPNRVGNSPVIAKTASCPHYMEYMKFVEGKPKMMEFGLVIDEINPHLYDCHMVPNLLVSKKIFDVLSPMNIPSIQLLEATLHAEGKSIENTYWVVNIHHDIKCIDEEKSDLIVEIRWIEDVKKVVLDRELLAKIPLEERLIFALGEQLNYHLYHKSVVDKIMATEPTGIAFDKFEDFTDC